MHILDQPLTDYLRFELYGYLDSVAVGSEIYVVDRDTHPDLAELQEDFWLYDDEIGCGCSTTTRAISCTPS